MQIVGAVLDRTGASPPYATSGALRATTLELDPPGPGEVLVRIEAAGLCHSDLSVVDGSRERPVPMLLGHEAAGIVEAVGSAGDDDTNDDTDGEPDGIAPGRRVVLTFLPRCGACAACATDGRLPCSVGSAANAAGTLVGGAVRLHRGPTPVHHHLGASAFATHAVVHRTSVVPVDDDVPADVAALLGCAVLTGGGAVVNAGRPAPGDRVTVVGLGGVGMAALLVARALGHEVLGVDPVPAKLELARSLGATACTPTEALDAALDTAHDGGARAPVVVEAAGSARAFETALALTAPGGTTVTAGLPGPDARASVAPLTLTAEARTVVGSYLGSSVPRRDIPRYVDLWRAGRLPLESLVSARIGLEDLPTALDQLAAGAQLRQLITFDERITA